MDSSSAPTIRDRLWLWAMPVNALQAGDGYSKLGWGESTITSNEVIERTGIRNVFLAGGFEINEESMASISGARRIVCKWSLHTHDKDKGMVMDDAKAEQRLLAAKALAATDRRIDAFHLDDFSTGSREAGASIEHLQRFQYLNALHHPALSSWVTVYTMSLEQEGLADCIKYFDQVILPIWFVSEIDKAPQFLDRCNELSGGKPTAIGLYFYDFGNGCHITYEQMQHQLDVALPLLQEKLVTGIEFTGTCMMDLGWPAAQCLYDWLDRVGDDKLKTG